MSESQCSRILKLLRSRGQRGATTVELLNLHIPRYGARVADLRRDGYNILTERVELPNGRPTNVRRYVLIEEDEKSSFLLNRLSKLGVK